jgi:hypothetical protein
MVRNILTVAAVVYAGVIFAGTFVVCDTQYAHAFLICAGGDR